MPVRPTWTRWGSLLPLFAVALSCLGLLGISRPVVAEDEPIHAPPMNASVIGAEAARIGTAYTKQVAETMAALEALMASPPEDPNGAGDMWRELCALPQQQLAEFRQALTKHLGGQKKPESHDRWLQNQTKAWRFVARHGGQGLLYLSRMQEVTDVWKTQHMPKIRRQKERFRAQGKKLNDLYVDARARARMRDDFAEAVKVVESRAAKARPMARTLGDSLDKFQELLQREVQQGDPKGDGGLEGPALAALAELKLAGEHLPKEPIWGEHGRRWGEYIFRQWKMYVETHQQYVKLSASLRAGTLFRDAADPLSTIKPYKRIGPEYERRFDDLLERFAEVREKLRALRKQAEEDARNTRALQKKYGADKDRAWRQRAARKGTPAEILAAKERAADRTHPGGEDYARLWRRHVEDRILSYEEMRERETPPFRQAWKRHVAQVNRELEEELEALQMSQDEAKEAHEAWKRERDQAWEAHDRELEAHAEEWEELGVPEPLHVYGRR